VRSVGAISATFLFRGGSPTIGYAAVRVAARPWDARSGMVSCRSVSERVLCSHLPYRQPAMHLSSCCVWELMLMTLRSAAAARFSVSSLNDRGSVFWVVFSGDGVREAEARNSAATFLRGAAESRVDVLKFRDGYFPFHGAEIKDFFEALKQEYQPAIVLTHG